MISKTLPQPISLEFSAAEKIIDSLHRETLLLSELIEISPAKLGGAPVLKGTRFSLAQLLAQLGDGDSLEDLVSNFDLDRDQLSGVLHALAKSFDRP